MTDVKSMTARQIGETPNGTLVEITMLGELQGVASSRYILTSKGLSLKLSTVETIRVVPQPLKVGDIVPRERLPELPDGSCVRGVIRMFEKIGSKGSNWYAAGLLNSIPLTSSDGYLLVFLP